MQSPEPLDHRRDSTDTAAETCESRDEFRALAAQLESEAAALANRYPPCPARHSAATPRSAAAAVRNRAAGWVAIGGSVALLVGSFVFHAVRPPPHGASRIAVSVPPTARISTDVADSAVADRVDEPVLRPVPAETVSVLHEVSGPELEGLLDLLESQPATSTSISI